MTYSAGAVAQKLHMSKDTLRYYEQAGLLPPINRDSSGHRSYSDSDVEWIFLIRCLRDTDMPIRTIERYVSLLMSGGDTISERRSILVEHQMHLADKIRVYHELMQLVEKKVEFYDQALSSDDPEAVKCMDYATEWEHFRSVLAGAKHD